MEKNNFVRVEVNPEDHRCRQVILFDKAFELGSEMKEHRKYMDSLITGALNDEEEKRTQKLLTRFTNICTKTMISVKNRGIFLP